MPKASNRGIEIAASPIRSLISYAREAKQRGTKVYHLNIGQPDIPTPPNAIKAMSTEIAPVVSYGHSEGMPALRSTYAEYYSSFGADIKANHVMVTTGASEAIMFTLMSVCDPGDEIIVPEPFYANYLGFAHLSNVRIVPVTSYLEDDFSLPTPAKFESLISPKTKAIFLCNPNNPTGQMYGKEELKSILDIVNKHSIFLIVDEVYREFCYEKEFCSVLCFEKDLQNVIVIDSISKLFSACGARVGYLVTKNEDILETANKFAQMRLCPPYFGQKLALACYDDYKSYISKVKEEYDKRRKLIIERLSEIDGLKFNHPSSAFYVIAELPVNDSEEFCKWLLTDFEFRGATVMLAPAHGFYFTQAYGKKQVRIAYILNSEELDEALECLKRALIAYNELMVSN